MCTPEQSMTEDGKNGHAALNLTKNAGGGNPACSTAGYWLFGSGAGDDVLLCVLVAGRLATNVTLGDFCPGTRVTVPPWVTTCACQALGRPPVFTALEDPLFQVTTMMRTAATIMHAATIMRLRSIHQIDTTPSCFV
jgi:hypothetical protein